MAINPALGASMNIQANYAVTSTVNTYDTPGVLRGEENQPEESSALSQQQQTNAQQEVGGAKTAQTSKTQSSQETQQSAETGAPAEAEDTANSEVAQRTLRLSMADNSRELQAKFNEAQAANKGEQAQQQNMTQDARRQVMLRNMENMVNLQLAQYTGNEPYSKANYREILGAVTNMQSDNKASKAEDGGKVSDNVGVAEKSEEKDGVYKLYSGQAAKTLASLNNPRGGGDDSFDLVA